MTGTHTHVSVHPSHTHAHTGHHSTYPSSATHRTHGTHHAGGGYSDNRARGLKAAINNPRTTHSGRDNANRELNAMGYKTVHPSLGTRIRHLFHLPGKSHGHTHHRTVYSPAPVSSHSTGTGHGRSYPAY